MGEAFLGLRRRLRLRHRYYGLAWAFGRLREKLRYARVAESTETRFHIASSSRNAGSAAIACLQSVYDQDYPRERVRHVFIDDASTDDTHERVTEWLDRHPDHNVEYIHQETRLGGTVNNLIGFDKAAPGTVVCELNGDDWFPDADVLKFLAKVYSDPGVWKTYNTSSLNGRAMRGQRPIPADVIRENRFRSTRWMSSALHTFRKELYAKVDPDVMIDPATGEHWASSDDQALYLAMLELAGAHSQHVYRVTYVYNFREMSEHNVDRQGQIDRSNRIRDREPFLPLDSLDI